MTVAMATTVWYIVCVPEVQLRGFMAVLRFAAGNKPQLLIQSELNTKIAK